MPGRIRTLGYLLILFLAAVLVAREYFHAQHAKLIASSAKLYGPESTYAFATFLGANTQSAGSNDEDDNYYMSVRQLAYALLHSPSTSSPGIPFLVFCTQDVLPRKRARLEKDGAKVVLVEKISSAWVHSSESRWVDMLTKLRMFEMTEYSKICYIDADTFVSQPLAGVFEDAATTPRESLHYPEHVHSDESALPEDYALAAHVDFGWYVHDYPPPASQNPRDASYLNAGFLVFKPSQVLFDYYMSLLASPDRFDPYFMEQSLLNYAHRREGNMPWQTFSSPEWNVNWPNARDEALGVRSFHDKFWEDGNEKVDGHLRELWQKQKAEMEDFYRVKEMR